MKSQPQLKTQQIQPIVQSTDSPLTKKSIMLLFILLGLLVITVSVFVGIQIGKSQITNTQRVVLEPTTAVIQEAFDQKVAPTIETTASWKTYVDSENHFIFKYPSNLNPQQNKEFLKDIYSAFISFEGDNNSFSLYVSLGNSMEGEVATIRSQTEGHINTTLVKNEAIKIDGKDGWLLEYTPEKPVQANISRIITSNGENVIVINANANIIDNVISTFKFIN